MGTAAVGYGVLAAGLRLKVPEAAKPIVVPTAATPATIAPVDISARAATTAPVGTLHAAPKNPPMPLGSTARLLLPDLGLVTGALCEIGCLAVPR